MSLQSQSVLVCGCLLFGIVANTGTARGAPQRSAGLAPQSLHANMEGRLSAAESAAKARPNDSRVLLNLVGLYDERGDFKKSVPLLKRALVLQPHNLKAYRILGIDWFRIGRYTKALKPLRTVVEVDPQDSEANFYLGLCYLALDRNYEAGEAFDRAAATGPASVDALYFLVEGYSRLSSAYLSRLVALGRNSYRMHELRGEYFELQHAPEQALKEYQAAVQMRPDLASLHYALGDAYWKLSRLDNAAAEFRQAIKLAPQHFMAHYKLGMVLLDQNNPTDALKEFRTALSEQPGLARAYLGLGKALYEEGLYDAAIPQLERCVELSPDNPTPHYLLFQIYRRLSDSMDADKQLKLFKQEDEILQAKKSPKLQ